MNIIPSFSSTILVASLFSSGSAFTAPLIGAGVFYNSETSVFKQGDSHSTVVPSFRYEGERLSIRGTTADWSIAKLPSWKAGIGINLDSSHSDRNELSQWQFEELDSRINLHVFARKSISNSIVIDSRIHQDFSGASDGVKAELSASYKAELAGIRIQPTIGLAWQDEKTNTALFGENQATVGSSLDKIFSVSALMPVTQTWVLRAEYKLTRLDDVIQNQPSINQDTKHRYSLGLMYIFSR